MMSMVHSLATRHWEKWGECVHSWYATASKKYPAYMVYEKPLMEAYNEVLRNTKEDIIAMIHDDVEIFERGWDARVLKEFDDPTVGLVGFGGGLGLGTADLYQPPYEIRKFARQHFMSNMRSAEIHGHRFVGERDVAVFDGFAIFARRSILEKWGGWPVGTPVNYFMYDNLISCETKRQGFRSRLVAVDCEHYGGRSPSIINEDIEAAHLWLFQNYGDVLPFRVE
jgi:hypothetical protein